MELLLQTSKYCFGVDLLSKTVGVGLGSVHDLFMKTTCLGHVDVDVWCYEESAVVGLLLCGASCAWFEPSAALWRT
jgi:hypothetical protein